MNSFSTTLVSFSMIWCYHFLGIFLFFLSGNVGIIIFCLRYMFSFFYKTIARCSNGKKILFILIMHYDNFVDFFLKLSSSSTFSSVYPMSSFYCYFLLLFTPPRFTPPRNRGGVIFSLQFVCVCPDFLWTKFKPNGCTDLDAVFAKWLLTALARTLLKLVTLGQRSRSRWPKMYVKMMKKICQNSDLEIFEIRSQHSIGNSIAVILIPNMTTLNYR